MSRHLLNVRVNGEATVLNVESRTTLLEFLREELGLVGAHAGCEHGVCGTCTVLVDGRSVRACMMLAIQAEDAAILTVEGLNQGLAAGELTPLQTAFWDQQALQCGFCTPGMLMLAYELLQHNPRPTAEQVRHAIASNLCRCTGYAFIVDAVMAAAKTPPADADG